MDWLSPLVQLVPVGLVGSPYTQAVGDPYWGQETKSSCRPGRCLPGGYLSAVIAHCWVTSKSSPTHPFHLLDVLTELSHITQTWNVQIQPQCIYSNLFSFPDLTNRSRRHLQILPCLKLQMSTQLQTSFNRRSMCVYNIVPPLVLWAPSIRPQSFITSSK